MRCLFSSQHTDIHTSLLVYLYYLTGARLTYFGATFASLIRTPTRFRVRKLSQAERAREIPTSLSQIHFYRNSAGLEEPSRDSAQRTALPVFRGARSRATVTRN